MAKTQSNRNNPANYNTTPATRTDGDPSALEIDINGNLKTTLSTSLNKTDDSITNYPAGCTMTEVDLATNADVVVSAVPCVLLGLYANVVFSAHAVNVIDDVTTKLILPASTAAGTKIDCHSAIFATNLSINSDDSATGKLVVFWRVI